MFESKLTLFVLTASALIAIPACHVGEPVDDDLVGDDTADDPVPDPQPQPDPPAQQPAGCPELLSYDLSLPQGTAGHVAGDPEFVVLQADVQIENAEPLEIFVSLFNGQGLFAGGYRPGTFSLTGIDTDATRCSLCVFFVRRDANDQIEKLVMASGGSADITAIDPPNGKLTGTITNAPMREVDPQTGADVSGGCTTTLSSYSFDVDISPAQ